MLCPIADMIEMVGLKNYKKLKKNIVDKAKKEGLSDEWIDCVFNLIFIHFILTHPDSILIKPKFLSFKCEECIDFQCYGCEGGNFPNCFIEKAKTAKKRGFKPIDLIEIREREIK